MDWIGKRILLIEGSDRQCLPYLKAFKEHGCETTILCNSKLDCGRVSRLPDRKVMTVCDAHRLEESERSIIQEICTGKYDIVMPLVDYVAEILSKNKPMLSEYAKIAVNDWNVYQAISDKLEVMRVCMDNEIPCPKTYFGIKSIEDVFDTDLQYPFIVKPRKGCGSKGFRKILNEQDLRDFFSLEGLCAEEYVFQECLPIDSRLISDNLFVDGEGNVCSSFLYECHRFYPLQGGTGTLNITFDREDIHRQCERLAKITGIRGCVGVDLMIDSRDNTAKVIEINPRVLACSKIGFLAGVDQALQTLELEFGQPITQYKEYKTDIRVRMSQVDVLWFLKSPDRFKAKPSFFSCKHTHDQMFAWSDPLPWFAFLLQGFKKLKNK